jgi:hypothetical protein
MATVIQGRPSQGAQNREAIGGALGNAITGAWQGYTQHHDQSAIQNAVAGLPPNASPREILDAVTNTRTYNPQAKQQAIMNYLGAAKQEETQRHAQATEEAARNQSIGSRASTMTPEAQKQVGEALTEQGFSPAQVTQYLNSPPGVQGAINREVKDSRERGLLSKAEEPAPEEPKTEPFPKLPGAQGKTRAEADKWRNDNKKHLITDLKKYNEETRANEKVEREIEELQKTAKAGNLPSGLGSLVINPYTGEPFALAQYAGLVNKDTQKWVKQVTDFIGNAKNFFGGRVTNFDVGVFKQRLPGLMNTQEGREAIMEMMLLNQKMSGVDAQAWKEAYHKYGDSAAYSDISSVVSKEVARRREEMLAKANELAEATKSLAAIGKNPEKARGTTLMKAPNGKFIQVPNEKVEEAKKKGAQAWK